MADRYSVTLEQGFLIADKEAVRSALDVLRKDVKADESLGKRYEENPRSVLGERGLALPIQLEVLADTGQVGEELKCILTSSICCQSVVIN